MNKPVENHLFACSAAYEAWQCELLGLGTPAEFNARLLEIMAQGANAVSLIPCNSMFGGYDMDE